MSRIVVVGAGGFGREALDVVSAMNAVNAPGEGLEVVGVLDDAPSPADLVRLEARGIPYRGSVDAWCRGDDRSIEWVLGVGDPGARLRLDGLLAGCGRAARPLVHPSAVVGSMTTLADGVVVCAGAQISTNVALGRHVHVNPHATIGHDCVLEEFVSVNPAAVISGQCVVRTGALVGAGAVVLQGLEVGRAALVGAAACVVRDVDAGATVKGVPAR